MHEAALYRRLGELVRLHRERLGINQAHVAEQTGLSRASIANIETGRQRIPLHHLYSLARALKVDAHALLPVMDATPGPPESREIRSSVSLSELEQDQIAKVIGTIAQGTKRGGG
jgi:transcriptional regulator with XRE-family HTH domain